MSVNPTSNQIVTSYPIGTESCPEGSFGFYHEVKTPQKYTPPSGFLKNDGSFDQSKLYPLWSLPPEEIISRLGITQENVVSFKSQFSRLYNQLQSNIIEQLKNSPELSALNQVRPLLVVEVNDKQYGMSELFRDKSPMFQAYTLQSDGTYTRANEAGFEPIFNEALAYLQNAVEGDAPDTFTTSTQSVYKAQNCSPRGIWRNDYPVSDIPASTPLEWTVEADPLFLFHDDKTLLPPVDVLKMEWTFDGTESSNFEGYDANQLAANALRQVKEGGVVEIRISVGGDGKSETVDIVRANNQKDLASGIDAGMKKILAVMNATDWSRETSHEAIANRMQDSEVWSWDAPGKVVGRVVYNFSSTDRDYDAARPDYSAAYETKPYSSVYDPANIFPDRQGKYGQAWDAYTTHKLASRKDIHVINLDSSMMRTKPAGFSGIDEIQERYVKDFVKYAKNDYDYHYRLSNAEVEAKATKEAKNDAFYKSLTKIGNALEKGQDPSAAIKTMPLEDPLYYIPIANVLFQKGQFKALEALYLSIEKCSDYNDQKKRIADYLAEHCYLTGKSEEAKKWLEKGSAYAALDISRRLYEERDWEGLTQLFDAFQLGYNPMEDEVLVPFAEYCWQNQDWDRAESAINYINEKRAKEEQSYYLLRSLLGAGETAKAESYATRYSEIVEENDDPWLGIRINNSLALAGEWAKLGKTEKAEISLKEALECYEMEWKTVYQSDTEKSTVGEASHQRAQSVVALANTIADLSYVFPEWEKNSDAIQEIIGDLKFADSKFEAYMALYEVSHGKEKREYKKLAKEKLGTLRDLNKEAKLSDEKLKEYEDWFKKRDDE